MALSRRRIIQIAGGMSFLWSARYSARAQAYPSQPIRWVCLSPWRPGGHTRSPRRPASLRERGCAGVCRELPGRQWKPRNRRCGSCAARRLYASACYGGQRCQRIIISVAQIQFRPGYCACRWSDPHTSGHGGKSNISRKNSCRVYRLRQSQSRQAQHGVVGRWHAAACFGRIVQDDGWRGDDPHSFSWRSAGAHRSHGKPGSSDVRHHTWSMAISKLEI